MFRVVLGLRPGSVVGLELGGRNEPDLVVESSVVEPVDVLGCGHLDVSDGLLQPPLGRMTGLRLRYARFPARRTLEDFDFDFQPTIDRKLVEDLVTCRFVAEGRPVLFLGQPGCGKRHLAVALAIKAVEAGYRGYFATADEMAGDLVFGNTLTTRWSLLEATGGSASSDLVATALA